MTVVGTSLKVSKTCSEAKSKGTQNNKTVFKESPLLYINFIIPTCFFDLSSASFFMKDVVLTFKE